MHTWLHMGQNSTYGPRHMWNATSVDAFEAYVLQSNGICDLFRAGLKSEWPPGAPASCTAGSYSAAYQVALCMSLYIEPSSDISQSERIVKAILRLPDALSVRNAADGT